MRELMTPEMQAKMAAAFADGRALVGRELTPEAMRPTRRIARYIPPPTLRLVADPVSDGAARLGHWQRGSTRQQRPQSRAQSRSRTGASESRDGPLPLDDDDPPDADLTPLQRATLLLLEALVRAIEGGARTYRTFLDLAAVRIAHEVARTNDWDERP